MKGCKLCEMFEYQQQHQKLLLKNGSLTTVSNPNGLHTNSSRLLNYCNHLASIRRSSTGSSGSACDSSNGSPSMSSASSSSSLLSVPSPTTSLPSPVASSATPAPSSGRAAAPTAIAVAAAVNTSDTTTTPMIGAPQRGSTPAKATTKSLLGADSILSSADGKCSSSSAPASSVPAAAAVAAVNLEQPYHAILPPHFRDMFYATHLFRGYYQPAGPLISQHGLPSGPQPNSSLVVSTKQVSSPLDPERDHQLSQLSHQPLSSVDNPDNDVLITGGDLTTFRYPSQQVPPGQPPQTQALSALGSSQPPPPQQPQQGSPYSRQIHPMHYPPYPPSYYSPYPGDAMCYPPPYQHYFPAKVYQSAPTYRRYSSYYQPGPPPPPSDLYDPASTGNPAQPPPPQPGSQLVPTGPSGPQHIEHYPGPPGFYTGYSPGGGECYPPRGMQPPYMEYPAPCPCPMQSCPKNVLTGPLIGSNSGNNNINSSSNNNSNLSSNSTNCNSNNPSSMINSSSTNLSSITSNNNNTSIANNSISSNNKKSLTNANQPLTTNKGPVRIQQHDSNLQTTPTTNRTNGQPILDSMHFHHHHLPCKMEILEPKPEIKSGVITEPMVPLETRKTGQYEETVIPPKSPAIYPANEKIVDTESLNTFRDSTEAQGKVDNPTTQTKGLETDGVTRLSQLSENKMNNAPPIVRKARIGKTMAREMYRLNAVNPLHPHPQTFNDHLHHHHHHTHHPSHNTTIEANNVSVSESHNHLITPSIDRIKKEEIKIEEEDDVVILEDEVKEVKTEPEIVEVHDKSSDPEDTEDLTKTDDDVLTPRLQTKRIKILDNKSLCKKSSPNGYKSLIKQAEPKSYLCLSASKRDKKNHFRKYSKLISRGGIRKRKIVLTEQQKKRLRERRRILLQMEKDNKQQQNERNAKVSCQPQNQTISNETESSNRLTYKPQTISSTDYANDNRGYFSEPDIRSTASRKTKKTRTAAESRSKSETKKSKSQKKVAKVAASSVTGMNGDALQASSEIMPKLPETIKLNSNHAIISQIDQDESGIETQESRTSKNSKPVSKSSKKKPKLKSQWTQKHIDQNECNSSSQPVMASLSISIPTAEPMDIDERIMDNDDDGLSEQNNNNNNSSKDTDYDEFMPMAVSNYKTSTCGKRARTRGYRFSKKRPKYRRCQTEVDDSIIPRRTNAVPKWNNGWSWLGEPFQAKVFLNSDDPLVIRTCYPAMQHIEGDIIRPRDCVLLKAGNKKNELPYVAKVAHLWENPEDGEMMMSLLWYYRPEHTEQGRQQNDCSDEVFASRHRDHNSVACIEDRCYVLTFSEYCRYRRRVRGAEEGIQNFNSIVPPLKLFANIPRVPVTTNPEQVMFCQRVYEFRLKRLLKTPTN